MTPTPPITNVRTEIVAKADPLTEETVLSIFVAAAKAIKTPDNVVAFVTDVFKSYLLSKPSINPIAPITAVRTLIATRAFVLTEPISLMMVKAPAIDNSMVDNATADPIVASTGRLANM